MTDSMERIVWRMDTQVNILVTEVNALRREASEMNRKFAEIQGGKKALWGLLAAASGAGGLIATIINTFFGRL